MARIHFTAAPMAGEVRAAAVLQPRNGPRAGALGRMDSDSMTMAGKVSAHMPCATAGSDARIARGDETLDAVTLGFAAAMVATVLVGKRLSQAAASSTPPWKATT